MKAELLGREAKPSTAAAADKLAPKAAVHYAGLTMVNRTRSLSTPWVAAALFCTSACLFQQKGAEQGQLAWLAGGLDSEFHEQSVRPDLEARAAGMEDPQPKSGVLAPEVSGPAAAVAVARPVDDVESPAPRPLIRIVGTPGAAHGVQDSIQVTLPGDGATPPRSVR